MSYNPTTIANYFISKYSVKGELTAMKLLKLTYLSYAWYLAVKNKKQRLTDELPLAWEYGPIFPSLYESLKGHGHIMIRKKLPNRVNDDFIINEDKKFLDKIWNVYGRYDGIYLTALTYKDGTPWRKVYKFGAHSLIPDDDIFEYYRAMSKVAV